MSAFIIQAFNLGKNLVEKAEAFATDFRGANQRMHNKTFTVDGKVAITGGRNVADEYFDYDHDFNFRDRDVLLIGGVVEDVSASFEGFWKHRLSVPVAKLSDQPKPIANEATYERLHAYACDPSNFWPQVRERIHRLPQAIDEIKASGDIVWLNDVQFIADTAGKNSAKEGLEGGGVDHRCVDSTRPQGHFEHRHTNTLPHHHRPKPRPLQVRH